MQHYNMHALHFVKDDAYQEDESFYDGDTNGGLDSSSESSYMTQNPRGRGNRGSKRG